MVGGGEVEVMVVEVEGQKQPLKVDLTPASSSFLTSPGSGLKGGTWPWLLSLLLEDCY